MRMEEEKKRKNKHDNLDKKYNLIKKKKKFTKNREKQ